MVATQPPEIKKKNKTLGQSSFLKIFLKFKVFGKYKQEENS